MILLVGLIDVFLRALSFIGLALAVGGVAFEWVILRPAVRRAAPSGAITEAALRRAGSLAAGGAVLVAVTQLLSLVIAPWALADDAGRWPVAEFLSTTFARAGLVHAAVAFLLALAALYARGHTGSRGARFATLLLAVLALATGGPLTHGASRLANPVLLMTVTVLHQLPAVLWVGGTAHLVAQWRVLRDDGDDARERLWPGMLARFSPVAMLCVGGLLAAGVYLSWHYVDTPRGLVGTAYGAMLLTKVVLMVAALALGGLNFLAIRDWRRNGHAESLLARVPVLIETEAAIGMIILMAAAALTGQPPAVDVAGEQATPAEVARVFAPRWPQLTTPPWREMVATSGSVLDPYRLPLPIEKVQSDFNHNVSGVFVLLAGLGALLFAAGVRWARHWPLVFVPLGVFVQIVGEPTVWPIGRESFFATLRSPEVLMHRTAGLLVIVMGIFEWRVRAGGLARTRWRYAFPLLCLVGGALLLTHSHFVLATRWAFLIEVSHNALGIFAVFAGAARWLELRLPVTAPEKRVAAAIWPVCLACVGLVLLFYHET